MIINSIHDKVKQNLILIQTDSTFIRSAILKAGELAEFFVEKQDQPSKVGAIYKAKIIQKGLSGYFVDLGKGQTAFLSSTTTPQVDLLTNTKNNNTLNSHNLMSSAPAGHKKQGRYKPKALRVGQYIMAQVIKDSLASKKLRVSQKISLPSAHLVYLPQDHAHIGISRQIEDPTLREKLTHYFQKETKYGGWIVRTKVGTPVPLGPKGPKGPIKVTSPLGSISRVSATKATRSALKLGSTSIRSLKKEVENLKSRWQGISQKYRSKKRAGMIHSSPHFSLRLIRDFLTEDIEEIWVDDQTLFLEIKAFMKATISQEKHKLKLYQSSTLSLFDKYDLELELNKLMQKKVYLSKGGFIIFEETEAAVVVDVNSGRFRGQKSTEENILKINLSAAKEITRQLRLRNCGGIVLIDFIDMETEHSREKLMEELALLLKKDRAPTNLFPLSELSIAQITRKRERPSLRDVIFEPCPHCEGKGHINRFKKSDAPFLTSKKPV